MRVLLWRMVATVVAGLVLLSFVPCRSVGETLNCKSENASIRQFENDSCVLIEETDGDLMDVMEAKCRSFDEYPNEWHLPTLTTLAKHDQLQMILREMRPQKSLWFWIGVYRYEPHIPGANWSDLTKWVWTMDNSTVNDTLDADHWGQPGTIGDQCAFMSDVVKDMKWYDAPCGNWKGDQNFGSHVLVCQSMDISAKISTTAATSTTSTSTTTTTTSTSTSTVPTTTPTSSSTSTSTSTTTSMVTTPESKSAASTSATVEDNSTMVTTGNDTVTTGNETVALESSTKNSAARSSFVWAAVGLSVTIVLLVAGLLIFHFVMRYRKRRLAKMGIQRCDDDEDSVSESSKSTISTTSVSSVSSSLLTISRSEGSHSRGYEQDIIPTVVTGPKEKRKDAAMVKVLPKGKSGRLR